MVAITDIGLVLEIKTYVQSLRLHRNNILFINYVDEILENIKQKIMDYLHKEKVFIYINQSVHDIYNEYNNNNKITYTHTH